MAWSGGDAPIEPWMFQQDGAAQGAPGAGGAVGARTRSRGAGAKMPFEFPIRLYYLGGGVPCQCAPVPSVFHGQDEVFPYVSIIDNKNLLLSICFYWFYMNFLFSLG